MNYKREIEDLVKERDVINERLRQKIFEYCKQKGLVSTSLEIESFAWKNAIRNHLGIVI